MEPPSKGINVSAMLDGLELSPELEAVLRPACPMEAALERHPVLRLFPDALRADVRREGALRAAVAGQGAEGAPVVGFVLRGCLAAFDSKGLACVSLLLPGSMFGWEAALSPAHYPRRLLALLDCDWVEMPAETVRRTMGAEWIEHVFARHALDRLGRLQADAACHAVHSVPLRAANLIRRLYLAGGCEVRTTQAALARAMGVQRTSVNAAVKALERDGAVAIRRGQLQIIDPEKLERFSCGC